MPLMAQLAPAQWYMVLGFVFCFGLLWGSFLNVVIHRLPRMLEMHPNTMDIWGSMPAPLFGKNGAIKTAAMVGGGGMMDVIGQIKDGDSKIKLDGYCKFEGPLTKK